MVPIAIHPQAATWPKKSAVEKRIMSWKTSFLFFAIEFVMTQSTRYLTGINETAEDMSLQRKPGCPKLEVDSS